MNNNKIGGLVKECRLSKGLTQAELAELASTGNGVISEIENGKRNPTVSNICSLFDVMGFELGFVVNEVNPANE